MTSHYGYSPYLLHFGVKGMKWGVRKKRDTYNKDYTEKQRKQDRAMYGRRAEKRINRRMNEGYGVKGARAVEKVTLKQKRAKTDRRVRRAKAFVGSVATAYTYDQLFNQGRGTRLAINLGKSLVKDARYIYATLYNMPHR